MDDPETGAGQRTLGVIDSTLTQLALGAILLAPTVAVVLARPKLLTRQIDEIGDHGRQGAVLAPGPLFAMGFLAALIALSFLPSDGALVSLGENVFNATADGQFWQALLLLAPLFLVGVLIGLCLYLVALTWGLKRRSLQSCIRAGLYGLFGLACIVLVAEPVSLLIGPGGSNQVYEPGVVGLIGAWTAYFHARALSAPEDGLLRRFGSALTAAAIFSGLAAAPYMLLSS